jgi:hypothetical protein
MIDNTTKTNRITIITPNPMRTAVSDHPSPLPCPAKAPAARSNGPTFTTIILAEARLARQRVCLALTLLARRTDFPIGDGYGERLTAVMSLFCRWSYSVVG